MCDPVCEHRFRSCHTVSIILSIDDIGYWTTTSFVEPLTLRQLSVAGASSWCRRISVRPPHDIEKSVAHRLHCAMPLSGNFAIHAPPILVKLAFSVRRHFFNGGSTSPPSHIPRIWKKARRAASYPKNAGDYPMRIHHPKHVTVAVLMQPAP